MYKGNNRKAIQSQRWLSQALCDLMQDCTYEKITIGDICLRADLSRQTFYNLFGSKNEILHFSLRDAYEEQFYLLARQETLTADDIVESFAHVVDSRRKLLNAMTENHLSSILAEEIQRCVGLFAGRFVPADEKDASFPYIEALTAGAVSGLLTYWLQQSEPISREELSGILSEFLEGSFFSTAKAVSAAADIK